MPGIAGAEILMVQIHAERTIAASPERVFEWLHDPANLTVSPVLRKAVWAKDSSGPGVGAVREVTGLGFWLLEQITVYDAPRNCAYDVVASFPPSQHEGGSVTCTPSGGRTHVVWESGYTVPARGGGRVMETLTAPLISFNLRSILAGCAKALES
jgi:Polyketide cyclase / dehydrase and lipid transport